MKSFGNTYSNFGQGKIVTSDLFYRSLFTHHPDIVFSLDIKGNLIEANQSFLETLGYLESEVVGPFKRFLPPDEIERVREYFYQAIDGQTQSIETIFIHKNDQLVRLHITLIPIVMNDLITGIFGIAKDITVKNRIEEQYKSLFTNIHNTAFVLDLNLSILDVNEVAKRIIGYSRGELINKSFMTLTLPQQSDVLLTNFSKVIQGGTVTFEFSMYDKNSDILDMQTIAAPITVNDEVTGIIGIARDITKEKEKKQQYSSLFEKHPDIVCYFDTEGRFIDCNLSLEKVLGYTKSEIIESSFNSLIHPDHLEETWNVFFRVLQGKTQRYENIVVHKHGNLVYVDITNLPIIIADQIVGVYAIVRDISEQKQAELALQEAELKYRILVEESIVGVYIIQNEQIVYANPRLYELLGDMDSIGKSVWDFVHPDDQDVLRTDWKKIIKEVKNGMNHLFRVFRKDGTVIDVEAHSSRINYQGKAAVIGTIHDITDRKKVEDMNRYLAYHDSLTNLPNRLFFEEKLDQSLLISKTLQQKLAVMYLDLDRFKYINDTLGHSMGDKLLIEVSKRFRSCAGDQTILARTGGDEFTAIFTDFSDMDRIVAVAKKIIHSLQEPFFIEEYELYVTTSIGISIYPNDGEDAEMLKKNADSALYRAKEIGKNTYQIYTPSLNVQTYKQFTLERDLRKAVQLNQLEMYYQPKVHLETGHIVGAEALIRWNHPEWGMVSPVEFIPLAEENGLILNMGKWIKDTVCTQNKAWQQMGLPAIPISINLSAQRFMHKDMLHNLKSYLETTNLDPQYLEVEITETTLLKNEAVVLTNLEEMRNLGIRTALDDFGTGYSSLSYLKQFKGKIDTLKIDRSFIHDPKDDDTQFLLNTIIQLAHHFKMTVVAEGIETEEQLHILRKYQCDIIQGFIYSKPVPAEEFAKLLRKGKLEAQENDDGDHHFTIQNQRRYFRINLDFPLSASMTITSIQRRKVEVGRTEVLIENIGLGGLCFLSNIKLAVHRDIILKLETEILGKRIKMYGSIVWLKVARNNIFQYGLEFSIHENERTFLAQLLNEFSLHLRKSPLVPECSFVMIDRYNYLNHKKESMTE